MAMKAAKMAYAALEELNKRNAPSHEHVQQTEKARPSVETETQTYLARYFFSPKRNDPHSQKHHITVYSSIHQAFRPLC